jgi:SSS family solute:Na+ symporter
VAGVPQTLGLIIMAAIVWFYVVTGGLKASTWVGVLQFLLLVGGIFLLGYFVITSDAIGGWSAFSQKTQGPGRPVHPSARTAQFRPRHRRLDGR